MKSHWLYPISQIFSLILLTLGLSYEESVTIAKHDNTSILHRFTDAYVCKQE